MELFEEKTKKLKTSKLNVERGKESVFSEIS